MSSRSKYYPQAVYPAQTGKSLSPAQAVAVGNGMFDELSSMLEGTQEKPSSVSGIRKT